ncbi:hypothetical protein Tco_0282397 [Tanacetum coccineum]
MKTADRSHTSYLIYGSMYVTRLARSYGILAHAIYVSLSTETHVTTIGKKSLTPLYIIFVSILGVFEWFPIEQDPIAQDDKDEEHELEQNGDEVRSSPNEFKGMSRGDWKAHQGSWMA